VPRWLRVLRGMIGTGLTFSVGVITARGRSFDRLWVPRFALLGAGAGLVVAREAGPALEPTEELRRLGEEHS